MESPEQRKFSLSDKGELFDLLSNHRRRYTIKYARQNGSITLSDLAERIAAIEQEKSVDQITSAERKRVYTSLQQTHLDRLEDAGMIRTQGDVIELTDRARELEVYMDIVPSESVSWSFYYLVLSGLAAVVVAGVLGDMVPPELLSESTLVVLIVVIYGVSAVAHVLHNRRNRLENLEDLP
jgi:hypothetical protein